MKNVKIILLNICFVTLVQASAETTKYLQTCPSQASYSFSKGEQLASLNFGSSGSSVGSRLIYNVSYQDPKTKAIITKAIESEPLSIESDDGSYRQAIMDAINRNANIVISHASAPDNDNKYMQTRITISATDMQTPLWDSGWVSPSSKLPTSNGQIVPLNYETTAPGVTGIASVPSVISFGFGTTNKTDPTACKLAFTQQNTIVEGKQPYVATFTFYSPSAKSSTIAQNFLSSAIVAGASVQSTVTAVIAALKQNGYTSVSDWASYICPALQALQVPTATGTAIAQKFAPGSSLSYCLNTNQSGTSGGTQCQCGSAA